MQKARGWMRTAERTSYMDTFKFIHQLKHGIAEGETRCYPLDLQKELKKHVTNQGTFYMKFPDKACSFFGFDLDWKESPTDVIYTAKTIAGILDLFEMSCFVYSSGSKGLHIESFFNTPVERDKIRQAALIIRELAISQYGANESHFDRSTYPCNSGYKIFGCYHIGTGNFTHAYDNSWNLATNTDQSWQLFKEAPSSSPIAIDNLISSYGYILKPKIETKQEVKPSKTKVKPQKTSGKESYSYEICMELYINGLKPPYSPNKTVFNLGRLFKHLKLDYAGAKEELIRWLKSHYKELANDTYFGDIANSCCVHGFDEALKDRLTSFTAGFDTGYSFGKICVSVDEHKANQYIDTLYIKQKYKDGLKYLVSKVSEYQCLTFYHSREQLCKGWGIKGVKTATAWVRTLEETRVLKLVSKGCNLTGRTNLYALNLPNDCYSVVQAQDNTEINTEVQEVAASNE